MLRGIGLQSEACVAAAEKEEVDVKAVAAEFEGIVAVLDLDTKPFDTGTRCQCREVFEQYHVDENPRNHSNDGAPVLACGGEVYHDVGGVSHGGDELYRSFLVEHRCAGAGICHYQNGDDDDIPPIFALCS